MILFLAGIFVFLINIPFGYWRDNVKKFSLQWFLAVHLPITAIVIMRIYTGLGFQFITFPVIIGAYFLGQYTGARIRRIIKNKGKN